MIHFLRCLALCAPLMVHCAATGQMTLEQSNALVAKCAIYRPHAAKSYDNAMWALKSELVSTAKSFAADFWGVHITAGMCPDIAALGREMNAKGLPKPEGFVAAFVAPEDGAGSGAGGCSSPPCYVVPVGQAELRKSLGIPKGASGGRGKVQQER